MPTSDLTRLCETCGATVLGGVDQTPVQRLTRDLARAAVTLTDTEARYLVDTYYVMQENRKRSRSQERALGENAEPHGIITYVAEQSYTLEKQIARALDTYTGAHTMGGWMRDVYGIGPILAAGLLAHIYMGEWCRVCHGHNPEVCQRHQTDKKRKLSPHEYQPIRSCPTVGHIWQFAGIAGDGQKKWEPNTRRPFNQTFKTLCWKIGDCFVKFSNAEECVYGHMYRTRKEYELARNERGGNRQHALDRLERDRKRGKPSKEAQFHRDGILSPGHLDLRARRAAVKQFLADLHREWYFRQFGEEAPLPYPIAILGHAHYRAPPAR